ncbi:MAG TPA: glycosyltransferase family 4 protein [Acetobacteraceae bacterium]|nr:glycosyltransferase family 4 protein [Acetobacteraceae bacterium]
MKVLVWQWGRRGAGPRIALLLARALAGLPDTEGRLALSAGAEILATEASARCDLLLPLYHGLAGLLVQAARAPAIVRRLAAEIGRLRPDRAVCAMPGPLDLLMRAALSRCRVPMAVIVHDADPHPGDGFPLQHRLNRALIRRAEAVIALSGHVARRLDEQHLLAPGTRLIRLPHPPLAFTAAAAPRAQDGRIHVLYFGRLLAYKGLDLLADALARIGPRADIAVHVVGSGPDSPALAALRALPSVTVENRWVAEDEIGAVIGWADIVVLPYREASQSGVAAAALAQGKRILATRVGGLPEQLENEPLAVLCGADAASIAAALTAMLDAPPMATAPSDASAAWRDFARRLRAELDCLVRDPSG